MCDDKMMLDFGKNLAKKSKLAPLTGSPLDIVKSIWTQRFDLKENGGYINICNGTSNICLIRLFGSGFTLVLTGFTDDEEAELRGVTNDAS